ncbi:MAG: ABC transporter transmembrane domain-containing protein, partial [Cyanobacteria bacterium P01_A01_bin.135]
MTLTPVSSSGVSSPELHQREISGHEPLLLTETNAAWIVVSGRVSIFAVEVRQGAPFGPRHYLFSVGPEEALFGHDGDGQDSHLALLAVPTEPTVVRRVILPTTLPDSQHDGSSDESAPISFAALKALVDPWILKLSQLDSLPEAEDSPGPDQNYLSLSDGAPLSPSSGVLWVKVQSGRVDWLGRSPFQVVSETGCFPVGQGTWVTAREGVDLFARPTAQVRHPIILVKGIAQLHRYTFDHLQQTIARKHLRQRRQFQQRQSSDVKATEATLRNLSGVLSAEDDRWLRADSPLLVAAGAVGRAMGVKIEPPSTGEDLSKLKEPLEAIARASRLRLRQVLLRGRWWQRDGGPVLAYREDGHRPVALLPTGKGRTRYELLDPEAPDEETAELAHSVNRQPLTPELAQALEPVAHVFYRPLPDSDLNAWSLVKFAVESRFSDVVAVVVAGAVATLIGMLVPQATALLIDDAIPYGNRALIGQIGIGLVAAAFGVASFNFARAIASMRLETVSDASLQAGVWDRLLRLRATFFRDYSTGDLSGRVSTVGAIRRQLSDTALQSIFSGAFALMNLGLLLYYSPRLALLALTVAVVVMAFTVVTGVILIRKHRPMLEL